MSRWQANTLTYVDKHPWCSLALPGRNEFMKTGKVLPKTHKLVLLAWSLQIMFILPLTKVHLSFKTTLRGGYCIWKIWSIITFFISSLHVFHLLNEMLINSLSPLQNPTHLQTTFSSAFSADISLKCIPQGLIDDKLTLVEIVDWWHQALTQQCFLLQCKPDISRLVGSKHWYRDISGSAIYRASVMSHNQAPFSSALWARMGP